jgi:hypothetical protein
MEGCKAGSCEGVTAAVGTLIVNKGTKI